MIDNFDSFTYNLVQYLEILNEKVLVKKNNETTIDEIFLLNPEIIVLSPGPGNPKNAGITLDVIDKFKGKIPILGICLGHQAIGQYFGGDIIKGLKPYHGKISKINHKNLGVFKGLKTPLNVTRYHSLLIKSSTLPKELIITAETELKEIMGVRHKKYIIEGVQFHPEAILTECGLELLNNFLMEVRGVNKKNALR